MTEPKVIIHELKDWKYSHTFGYFDLVNKEIHILNRLDMFDWILYHETEHYKRRKALTTIFAALFQNPIAMIGLIGFTIVAAICAGFGQVLAALAFLIPMIICMLSYYYEEMLIGTKTWKNFKRGDRINAV